MTIPNGAASAATNDPALADGWGVPNGSGPDSIWAGLDDIQAAQGQSTLGAVMSPEQMADAGLGGSVGDGDAPVSAATSDIGTLEKPITPDVLKAQSAPKGPPPDPAGYARDGEMARDLWSDSHDPDGNTGIAGLAYTAGQELQFHRGGTMDAQAHGGLPADGNYDFGVYNAAAGIPLSTTLDLANTYAKNFSKYPSGTKMDPTYKFTPAVNVQNIAQGHNDYQNGKFGGTD